MNESTVNFDFNENLASTPTYRAGVAQSTAYRLLGKLTESIIRQHGLTTMQWYMIGTIYDAGRSGIGVTELSQLLDTNVPYVTNTINILVTKGIVDKLTSTHDARIKRLVINPGFESQVVSIEEDIRNHMRQAIYPNVTPAELRTYVSVLYKLSQSLK